MINASSGASVLNTEADRLQNCVLMFVCYSVGSRVWAVLELSRALQLQIFFGVLKVDEISLPFHPNGGGRGGGGGEG